MAEYIDRETAIKLLEGHDGNFSDVEGQWWSHGLNAALEEFFRLPLNQWGGLAERLAFKGVDLQDEKTRERNFDRCITTRDAVRVVFEAAGKILWGHEIPPKDDQQLIAEDIWQVIRHQLYLDSGSTDTWRVDAREAIQWGPEPLPMIKRIEE